MDERVETYLELDHLMAASLSGVNTCSPFHRQWNYVLRELSVIHTSPVLLFPPTGKENFTGALAVVKSSR